MELDDPKRLARAVRAYERGRAVRAATLSLPLAALAVMGARAGAGTAVSLVAGGALVALAFALLFRGRAVGRAVLPGVVAGLVPLTLALASQSIGHVCTGAGCTALCVPACTLGGLIAGLGIARAGRAAAAPLPFYVAAGALASLVGALGCACVGATGVVGLAFGLAVTLTPSAVTAHARA